MDESLDRRTILKAVGSLAATPFLPSAPVWAQAASVSARPVLDPPANIPVASLRASVVQNANAFIANWTKLPVGPVTITAPLTQGATGPDVATLRQRLGLAPGDQFDAQLGQAIAAFRSAHGLPGGSQADAHLAQVLNLGPSAYAMKVQANLARAKRLPEQLGERFILVDSASQRLLMCENGAIKDSMRVVVGLPEDPTPLMSEMIRFVTLNPYWNVPPDLVQVRYAPRVIAQGKSYLTSRGFEALTDWSDSARVLAYEEVDWKAVAAGKFELPFRQRPGPGNGMARSSSCSPTARASTCTTRQAWSCFRSRCGLSAQAACASSGRGCLPIGCSVASLRQPRPRRRRMSICPRRCRSI
jgi:murein L,D-transpeptidase YcbB/YkuD